MRRAAFALLVGVSLPAPALARDFCPDRPRRANPPCVIEPGRVDVEASLVDWSRASTPGASQDQWLIGDLLVRTGLNPAVEARIGLTSYGVTRTYDPAGVAHDYAAGDLSLGLRWNLAHPGGSGASVALQPTLTLPTGGRAIGAGTWGAALALPASFDLGHGASLGFTPQVAAAPNIDRRDWHLAYSGALALGHALTKRLAASAEVYAARDEAPDRADRASPDPALALALKLGSETQFDSSAYLGLTPDTPDVEAIVGIAHRF